MIKTTSQDKVFATEHRKNANFTGTRRLGARASAFLGRVLVDSPCAGARTEFETQLGAAMARYNALAPLAWARQLVRDALHL